MCVSSYSKVGAIEQRYMVNSGVRGTKNNHLMIEMGCTYYLSYHNLVPSTGNLHYWYSRRFRRFGLVAGAPSGRCGHARAVPGIVHYTIQEAVQCGMLCRGSRKGRRRGGEKEEGGTRERGTGRRKSLGLLVVRQQELLIG
jgi:hypothetical protein